MRNTPLQCSQNRSGQTERDRFYTMSDVRLPDNPQNSQGGGVQIASSTVCAIVLVLPTLIVVVVAHFGMGTCLISKNNTTPHQMEELLFSSAFVASELPDSRTSKGVITATVVGCFPGSLILLLIIWFLVWRRRRGMVG